MGDCTRVQFTCNLRRACVQSPGIASGNPGLVDSQSPVPRRSPVVAGQLPLDAWHAAMADLTLTDAILDRLVHRAYEIVLKGGRCGRSCEPTRQTVRT